LRLSSVNKAAERVDLGPVGQYSFEAARLNPNMTVPFLEVEDKVITDSRLIADHLFQVSPGVGDLSVQSSGKTAELTSFVDLIAAWDEAVWCFSQIGDNSTKANIPRFVTLHKNVLLAASQARSLPPIDGRSVEDVYLKKIAGLRFFQHMSSSAPDAADYQKQNRGAFEAIWERANELLTAQGVADAFLFGSELTTADAFFVPFLYRVEFISKAILKEHFGTYPRIRSYWEQVQLTDEAKSVTGFGKPYIAKMMLSSCLPCKMCPYFVGCRKCAPLTDEMEQKISTFMEEKKQEVTA